MGGRELKTLMGTCKNCQQQRIVMAPWDTSQKDLDEIATLECSCPQSCLDYERRTSYQMACGHIHKVIQQDRVKCKEEGQFERLNNIELLEIMSAGVLSRGHIKKVSIDLDSNNKVTLSLSSKGKLKVTHAYSDKEDNDF